MLWRYNKAERGDGECQRWGCHLKLDGQSWPQGKGRRRIESCGLTGEEHSRTGERPGYVSTQRGDGPGEWDKETRVGASRERWEGREGSGWQNAESLSVSLKHWLLLSVKQKSQEFKKLKTNIKQTSTSYNQSDGLKMANERTRHQTPSDVI